MSHVDKVGVGKMNTPRVHLCFRQASSGPASPCFGQFAGQSVSHAVFAMTDGRVTLSWFIREKDERDLEGGGIFSPDAVWNDARNFIGHNRNQRTIALLCTAYTYAPTFAPTLVLVFADVFGSPCCRIWSAVARTPGQCYTLGCHRCHQFPKPTASYDPASPASRYASSICMRLLWSDAFIDSDRRGCRLGIPCSYTAGRSEEAFR